MTATPPSLASVRMACTAIVEHATVAAWMAFKLPDEAKYHCLQVDAEFRRLADLMGYDLVKRGGE